MGDSFYKNHCVDKKADDYMLDETEVYKIQFQKLETVDGEKKYIRSEVNCGKKQFMEILEKYGLADMIANRWKIWDKEKKKNLPFQV